MGFFTTFRKKQERALSEPALRWNRFIAEICTRDPDTLSEIQKNAVLCFRYDAQMNNGGHCLYFDCCEGIAPRQLFDAITAVGGPEIAANFAKAAAEGHRDDWAETDWAYGLFSPSLCDRLMAYVEEHRDVIFL